MAVDTGRVRGRRKLRFASFEELLQEVDRLVECEREQRLQMLGNWTLAQILEHLARGKEASIDGPPFQVAWYLRFFGPLLKRRFIRRGVPAGVKLPAREAARFLAADSAQTEAARERLRYAIYRLQSEAERVEHGVLGPLTREEWDEIHLRHSEMHLSFALPRE